MSITFLLNLSQQCEARRLLGLAGLGQLWPSDHDGGDDHGFAIIIVVVIIVVVVMIGCGGLEGGRGR